MSAPGLTISGHSTALYSTWYFVEELGLLLDCGDGACSALQQKSRKVRTIACSHADRDHLNGLPQFLQLNVREKQLPTVLYPKDCGSFSALRDFLEVFDRRDVEENRWEPFQPGKEFSLGKANASIEAFANRHIEAQPGETKSLSFRVFQERRKLRPELQGKPEEEIARLHQEAGDDAVTLSDPEEWLAYSADTPIEPPQFWGDPRILIHESTFLDRDDAERKGQHLRHSVLPEVLDMACQLDLDSLILGHFSTRYSPEDVEAAVRKETRKRNPAFPVHAVLPGRTHWDLLRETPLWKPN